ncbi:MAG TPA: hypothetical protein VF171_07280 [Trueperaceae bacterium]
MRSELIEPQPGFWTDDELNRWLDEADQDLTEAAQVEAGPFGFSVEAGVEDYALPADFLYARRVEVGGVRLRPGRIDDRRLPSIEDLLSFPATGSPDTYFIYAGRLHLSPVPAAGAQGSLWYYRGSLGLADDMAEPAIPARYHRLHILYAVAQAKRKADDPAYATYTADYTAGRLAMMQELRDRGEAERFAVVRDDWEVF